MSRRQLHDDGMGKGPNQNNSIKNHKPCHSEVNVD